MTLYVIGDIQGCYARLQVLLDKIHAACINPRLLFIGDLVNRGPDSLATLRLIQSLGDRAIALLGNHDLHLLAVSQGIRQVHRSDTLNDILMAPDHDAILNWLRQRPLVHFENNHLMVHAGVLPQWDAEQTLALANEVETALRSPDWVNFLRGMYGNTPAKWDNTLTGPDRLRCIVNALTRIRVCTNNGTMDLVSKEGMGATPQGYLPWFDVPGRKTENITVVFGHWSTLGLVVRSNLIGLDTGCVWGGKLTAISLNDRTLIQVDCPQFQKPK